MRPNSQDFAWIVRGEIASAADLQPAPLEFAGLPCDARANAVWIRLLPDQSDAKPVVPRGGSVPEKNGSIIVHADKKIRRAVVVEVTQRHPARGITVRENRSGLFAHILQPS